MNIDVCTHARVCKSCGMVTRDVHINQRGCDIKVWNSSENVYKPCVCLLPSGCNQIFVTISQGSRSLFFTRTHAQRREEYGKCNIFIIIIYLYFYYWYLYEIYAKGYGWLNSLSPFVFFVFLYKHRDKVQLFKNVSVQYFNEYSNIHFYFYRNSCFIINLITFCMAPSTPTILLTGPFSARQGFMPIYSKVTRYYITRLNVRT